jgi:dTDP-4-amino-4,6-dideoxygalactose transaminase
MGLNSRLDEIQAAVLRVKLKRLDEDNQKRKDVACYYTEHIKHPNIALPQTDEGHVWHLFVIRCKQRDRLQTYLLEKEVQTLIHYPVPPHKQKAYSDFNGMNLPVTEEIHREVLSLPISPLCQEEELRCIVNNIDSYRN